MRNAMRQGFTLLEMLVTLILLGILVAIVFPVITQQVDDAEPTKAANDLANIRTAMELFHLNIRPTYPGDLEDLAVEIVEGASADSTVSTTAYATKDVNRWKGPYIDATVTSTTATDTVIETGFSGGIMNGLVLFDTDTNEADDFSTTTASFPGAADFVAVRVNGLSTTEFEAINDLIDGDEPDGTGAGGSQVSGKLRYLDADATGTFELYYLAVPYTN